MLSKSTGRKTGQIFLKVKTITTPVPKLKTSRAYPFLKTPNTKQKLN